MMNTVMYNGKGSRCPFRPAVTSIHKKYVTQGQKTIRAALPFNVTRLLSKEV
jgi:hypothetical protein